MQLEIKIVLVLVFSLVNINYSSVLMSQCCINYNEQYTPTNVPNTFYPPQSGSIISSGSTIINLNGVPGVDQFGNSYGTIPISAGDLLLIIQIQGASFNSSNTSSYGSGITTSGPDGLGATGLTSLNNIGYYEFAIAENDVPLSGGSLQINGACSNGGLLNNYANATSSAGVFQQRFQVVRVPRYDNLTLTQDLTTTAWNGLVGGVLAISVLGTLDFNGFNILAVGRGFRGGYQNVRPSGNNVNIITTGDINLSSGKGEGVCGTPRFLWNGEDAVDNGAGWYGYEGGNYGRGAPGNAGGGGNIHNAGGGGGSGYGSGGSGGNGISGAGNAFPNGGRPGSGILFNSSRLIFGGGGGGGDANNAQTGIKGGAGGGAIFITAGNLIGSGTVNVSGSAGQFGIYGTAPDGAGGGGGGGSIYLNASQPSPTAIVSLFANGGNGGNTLNDTSDPHGPGGGGGGGAIFFNLPAASVSTSVSAGFSGATNNGNSTANAALPGLPGIVQILDPMVNNPITSLTVYPTPLADFMSGIACTNSLYNFVDASTVASGSVIEEYYWDFGDGSISTDSSPNHSYASPGIYNVQLIIETNFGCRDTIVKQMQVGAPYYDSLVISNCNSYTWPVNGQTYTNSGTYTELFQSQFGCDSAFILELTINESTISTEILSSCNEFTWPVNGQTYTSSGIFTEVLQTQFGCDSTVNLNLTINESITLTQTQVFCDSYTWPVNGQTYTNSGVYTEVLQTQFGCDSTIILDLIINESTISTETLSSCNEFTWPVNGQTYTSSGIYTEVLQTQFGCDSTLILELTINESTISTETLSSCNEFTWPVNGQTYTSSGIFTEVLQTQFGCDSTVNLNLTIYLSNSSQTQVTSCDNFIWNGQTYNQSGIYSYQTTNSYGCDSIAELNLTIYNSVQTQELVRVCNFEDEKVEVAELSTIHGCDSTHTIIYEQYPLSQLPLASFSTTPTTTVTLPPGFIQTFNSSQNATSYTWDFGGGSGLTTATNPAYTYQNEGQYEITLVANNETNCPDTSVQFIVVQEDLLIYVPNTFTPDGDNFNDVFLPILNGDFDPYNYTLLIFNRWGEVVFESRNAEIGWDGTYGGKTVQDGTYIWKIRLQSKLNAEPKEFVGLVSVLK